ncbi:hypothetical protein LTR28_007093 [Elasticomyces elasticus]|nr:hypothetical protein LTR28_007093 [Elasticomyces elasticus]
MATYSAPTSGVLTLFGADVWHTLFLYSRFATLVLAFPAASFVYKDYKAFIALGPGGTPQTVAGYLRIKALGCFTLHDTFTPPPIPPTLRPYSGFLGSLPQREGTRPTVGGIAPHRQRTQKAPAHIYAALASAIEDVAAQNGHRLRLGTSCFEKNSMGLFSVSPLRPTCKGEICHSHPSDGSMHMALHPADVRTVLESGWGERHPLARGGWLERFVPGTFVMIYAPRDTSELRTVMEIVDAATCWVAGPKCAGWVDGVAEDGEGNMLERRDSACGMLKQYA